MKTPDIEFSWQPVELPKTVSPLRKLLMDVGSDTLLLYLHQTNLQYTLTRRKRGDYYAIVFKDGVEKFKATSHYSARSALCDALARFLVTTNDRDFHQFTVKPKKNPTKTISTKSTPTSQ